MRYPMRNDYNTAISNLGVFVFDNCLKNGRAVTQKNNPSLLRCHNGGKAIVYEIETNPKKYALKCWVEDLGNLKSRYKEIDAYLKSLNLPYFIDFAYMEKGILVNGTKYPIVRMEWFDGISFKNFIKFNIADPVNIRRLAEDFLDMVKALHQSQISHGDLQHGNIQIGTDGKIGLIDYDSMYVPNLAAETDDIKGLPGYQHPARNNLSRLSPKTDYFSELVIYTSLLAISEQPSFWARVEKEERLLFSEDDFAKPRSSSIFSELRKLSPEVLYLVEELEKFCIETDIENLKPLEHCVSAYTGSRKDWDFPGSPPIISPPSIKSGVDQFGIFDNPTVMPSQITSSSPSSAGKSSWDKFSSSSSAGKSSWDKFSSSSSAGKSSWDKFSSPSSTGKSSWDKFSSNTNGSTESEENQGYGSSNSNDIWDKFVNSISSVWNKIINWFRP